MRVALLVAAKDLRQRLRDRSAILIAVVAPLGLAVIFSQLLGSTTAFHTRWVVADLDGGPIATVLRNDVIGSFEAAGVADVTDAPTADAARAAVAAGDEEVAFVIPADFSAAVQAGRPVMIEIIGARDEGLATEIARAVATRFGNGVVGVQLAVHTVGELAGQPLPPADQGRVAAAAAALPPAVVLVDEPTPLRQLDLPTYFAASMSILFLFFAAQAGIVSLFQERRNGTLARILAGPVRPASILAGKSLGSFALGVIAMTVLIAATTLLIGADWGPPPGVLLLVMAAVFAAVGISTFVASFATSATAAAAASSAVAITLGILGGSFSPTSQAPDVIDDRAPDAARLVPAGHGRHARHGRVDRRRPAVGRRAARDGRRDLRARRPARATPGCRPMIDPGKALAIARVNVIRQVRDRADLFFVFILPTIIIVALGLQFGGPSRARIGVVAPPGDAVAAEIESLLAADETRLDVRRIASEADLRTQVERGKLEAGVVVPGDLAARLEAGDAVEVRYVGTSEALTAGIRAPVEAAVAHMAAIATAARMATAEGAGTWADAWAAASAGYASVPGVAVDVSRVGEEGMFAGFSQFAFGASTQLILFMFLTSMAAAAALVDTKQLGVSRRMVSTPTSAGTIVGGELLGRLGVALLQATYIVLVSALVFGVVWGDPLAVGAVILAFALVAASVAMLVGAVATSPQQASSMGVFVGLALGALGGCMIPIQVMPDVMQQVARLIPHSWALLSLQSLITGGGLDTVLPNIAVLLLFSAVLLPLAAWRFRRAITG